MPTTFFNRCRIRLCFKLSGQGQDAVFSWNLRHGSVSWAGWSLKENQVAGEHVLLTIQDNISRQATAVCPCAGSVFRSPLGSPSWVGRWAALPFLCLEKVEMLESGGASPALVHCQTMEVGQVAHHQQPHPLAPHPAALEGKGDEGGLSAMPPWPSSSLGWVGVGRWRQLCNLLGVEHHSVAIDTPQAWHPWHYLLLCPQARLLSVCDNTG